MEIRPINENLAVAPQIIPADLQVVAQKGYKTVIANRPDGEEMGQPLMAEIQAAAEAAGLTFIYQPVQSGAITDEDVKQFGQLIQHADGPVLAFCRTGTRCTVLWALDAAASEPVDSIVSKAREAGYDLSGLVPRLIQQAG